MFVKMIICFWWFSLADIEGERAFAKSIAAYGPRYLAQKKDLLSDSEYFVFQIFLGYRYP